MKIWESILLLSLICASSCQNKNVDNKASDYLSSGQAIVISTWANVEANDKAFSVLAEDGTAIDAVEQGIRITEEDESDSSVGLGGLPDASGRVTLDACIMNHLGDAGSVTYLDSILHPISVARIIMDSLDHVMLSGAGALVFAKNHGFVPMNLLTDSARIKWQAWIDSAKSKKADNHDTIGMLAMDNKGNISGGCSTSGMAYKVPGRVGDSPIIGAGLFVDNEVGAATATGKGEEVMKSLGSFLIVELMRQGKTPQQACEEAVLRIVKKYKKTDFQIGYIALNKKGEIGAYSLEPGFQFALTKVGQTTVNKALSHY